MQLINIEMNLRNKFADIALLQNAFSTFGVQVLAFCLFCFVPYISGAIMSPQYHL
jgi:hypothetical protein